jgi:hypothetical protein
MPDTLKSIVSATLLCLLIAAPLQAQTMETADARVARAQVERIPIGATVTLRMRDGERLKAVLFSADEAGIRVKPATRVPEPSRRIAYDRIERIERKRDHVSVGKYVGVGSAIGAGMLLLLLAGV